MMPPKTIFGLFRHAETEWNRQKRIQGQQDAPLTEDGRDSARRWGLRLAGLEWDRLMTSDLGRAMKTAELINDRLKLPVHPDPGLREQRWGDWTARTIPQLKAEQADRLAALEAAGWDFTPPGGESRRRVLDRSRDALLTAAQNWPGQRILVVCHEGVIKCLIYHLSGRRFLPGAPRILKPLHLHLLSERAGRLALDRLNWLDLAGTE